MASPRPASHQGSGKKARVRVTLSEQGGVRYLHFGSVWVQGAMRVARPFALELEYQQQMMALGLLLPRPRRILQLGLGAAALTKFCWRHCTEASVTAVDISESVIATALLSCLPRGAGAAGRCRIQSVRPQLRAELCGHCGSLRGSSPRFAAGRCR